MRYLFVYGTLKSQGERNFLLDDSEFISEISFSDYSLFTVDGLNFPFMVSKNGGCVFGELYRISDEVILELDYIENHPDLYVRTNIGFYKGSPVESYLISMDKIKDIAQSRTVSELQNGVWKK